jgi:hypothetical protein
MQNIREMSTLSATIFYLQWISKAKHKYMEAYLQFLSLAIFIFEVRFQRYQTQLALSNLSF